MLRAKEELGLRPWEPLIDAAVSQVPACARPQESSGRAVGGVLDLFGRQPGDDRGDRIQVGAQIPVGDAEFLLPPPQVIDALADLAAQ
jgi:hypothetical protein